MAVVVEQTIPFPANTLDLENEGRWNTLLPLIRPTIKPIKTPKGQTILLDTSLVQNAGNNKVLVAAVGTAGNFSSSLLDDRKAAAIVTAPSSGSSSLSAQEIRETIQTSGAGNGSSVVVVRAGKKRHLQSHDSDLLELETEGALELDHALSLLDSAEESVKSDLKGVAALLEAFVKGVAVAHSTFHVEKADGNPAVLQVSGPAGFEKAKHAVERDLQHVLKQLHGEQQGGDMVYSVHYSDVNGLSRLENYILAKEIAEYLAPKLPYRLSHSTILNHKAPARGFSVSISPIPSQYLSAQQQPISHQPTSTTDPAAEDAALAPSTSNLTFTDAEARQRIQSGCAAVIAAEPTITDYDTIVGDGDCGYTLRDGAKQVLSFIETKDLSASALPSTLAALVRDLEVNMGGTSGALYCIFLTALAGSLGTETSVGLALRGALKQLVQYTRARLGDRTMMDALIPFVDAYAGNRDLKAALEKAEEGVEGTKRMEAKLGRSTYLDESATHGVPDPGAYGLFVLLKGMAEGA